MTALKLALRSASFHVRNLRTRLPFRYGIVTLTHFPLLHLAVEVEDLTNVPVVALQQDLATVRALGIAHAERNGHHYVRGMAHCSPRERREATRLHADLYRGGEAEAYLRIDAGHCGVGSLAVPGYGIAFDPDLDSMTALDDWRFESLEAST